MPAQTRIIHFYVCLGAAGGKECEVIMKHSIKLLSSLTMIIGVSLSTITSVNAYNYNKNAFENTDELKIIYNQIAKKEKSINACSLDGQAIYTWGYPTTKGRILVTGDAYRNLIPTGHAAIVFS